MAWSGDEQMVPVRFTGTRRGMAILLLRGYLLLLPTIGLYRFWLTTWKRRFYWSHTEIGGDALEYTGNALQLLLGFLMALAVFVPLYGLFFYLSTQSSEAAIVGYGGVAILVWFLMGYAIYRARDFRLSRTLWRGIRFDQAGSAWRYAFRRFFWSLLVMVTGGLAYPFMTASLWRYRYSNSWFGDRSFGFTGNWRLVAKAYYLSWLATVVIGGIGLGFAAACGAFPDGGASANPAGYVPLVLAAALIGLVILTYRSREISRMFSAVTLGQAKLHMQISARSLIGQYLLFGLALLLSYLLLAAGGFIVLRSVASAAFANGGFDLAVLVHGLQSSFVTLLAILAGYLLLLAAFSLMRELFLGLGYWKLLARGASISGLDSLGDVRARGEDTALGGEGLADALNVGAY